ncbi:translation initiation factor [Pirellulaceae bacterium SH449]
MGLFDGTSLERPVLCDRCHADIKVCQCPPPDVPPSKQKLRLQVEKRKKGKMVTSITGFSSSEEQQKEVLVQLKNACGAGGCLSESGLEIQGDHKEIIQAKLKELGFRV